MPTLPDYTRGNPYSELYIYYIAGRVNSNYPLLENFIGNWEEDGFSFLFFSEPAVNQVTALLEAQPQLSLLDNFHMRYHEWQGVEFQSMKIGKFRIHPPWLLKPDSGFDATEMPPILLDPGVVFGTGTHATTKDCLEAVATAMEIEQCHSALDLGTGTGLLALAVTQCGCRSCLAVDLNALATSTAAVNVRLNHWENKILVVRGRAEDFIHTPTDLLIANIHFGIMKELIHSPGFLTKKMFVLSGLLRSEAGAVKDFLNLKPVKILQEWSGDGIWHTFLGMTLN